VRREDAAATAAGIRAKVPPGASVAEGVATIIRHVRKDGDLAVGEMEAEFGEVRDPFRISDDELDAALAALDPAVRAGLEVAIANVRAVAEAGLDDDRVVTLPEAAIRTRPPSSWARSPRVRQASTRSMSPRRRTL
jgi:histidinol dehydrogenase